MLPRRDKMRKAMKLDVISCAGRGGQVHSGAGERPVSCRYHRRCARNLFPRQRDHGACRCPFLEPGRSLPSICTRSPRQARRVRDWWTLGGRSFGGTQKPASLMMRRAQPARYLDAMALAQLLASQRRAEVGVAIAEQTAKRSTPRAGRPCRSGVSARRRSSRWLTSI